MKQKELVSIIIPVYNAAKFLEETIKSVLNQTYENWELLLVDDCSSDKSVDIIKKYMVKDKRIKLFQNSKNMKVAITRNNGIKIAQGRYICYLDADDFWDNQKIENKLILCENIIVLFHLQDMNLPILKGN